MRLAAIALALLLSFAAPVAAESGEWTFVWVAPGQNSYSVASGKGNLTVAKGKLSAVLVDENGISYQLTGSIAGERVKVKLSVLGSDYFVNSPFAGSFTRKRWRSSGESAGRESISLTDGWNFMGLTRDIRP